VDPRYTAVQDVGTAIHPSYVEGQMQGGAAQGIGWALNEEYIYNAKGKLDNAGFLDYRMPASTCHDQTVVGSQPASSLWRARRRRVPIVPPLAAIANAIDATGSASLTSHIPAASSRPSTTSRLTGFEPRLRERLAATGHFAPQTESPPFTRRRTFHHLGSSRRIDRNRESRS
jgi:hypothetical protein